jgi:Ni/Fe-hydrogenase subunit HybB-like protein
MAVLAVLYILAYALVLSLLAYDLVMSADPQWISTLFAPYAFVKAFYMGLGALIIVAALVRIRYRETASLSSSHFHDLGKLFFAFCLLWADFFYCQFLVIWYGNIPEETSYIIQRTMTLPWSRLAWTVFILSFVIPFLILLNKQVKTKPRFMIGLCSLVLVGIWLEHFLLLGPALSPKSDSLPIGVTDVLITLGFLGLMAMAVRFALGFFPELVPVKQEEVK